MAENNNIPWVKPINGTLVCVDLRPTDDGGYVIAGYTGASDNDACLVKTDAYGNVQWNRTCGGSKWDIGYAAQQTSDGGYILAGRSDSFDWRSTAYLVKTDALGNILWSKTLGGQDDARYVLQTSDGGYILTGEHYYENPPHTFYPVMYLMKTDASGNLVWQRNLTTQMSGGNNVIQTADGGYVVAGFIDISSTRSDDYLVKTDSDGNVLWNRTYDLPMWNSLGSVKQTSDGGFILWSSAGRTSADSIMNLIKTDASGVKQWNKTFSFTGNDLAASILQTQDGGYLAVYTSNPPYGTVYAMKLDANGVRSWGSEVDSIWSQAMCAAQSPDGSFVIAGYRWYDGMVSAFLANVPDVPASRRFTINLNPGWNLISPPLENSSLRASNLVCNPGTGVDKVAVFNGSTQLFSTYLVGKSHSDKDFAIVPEAGYFVNCTGSGATLTFYGVPVKNPLTIKLYPSWNLIGWSAPTGSTAQRFGGMYNKISKVASYDSVSCLYTTYLVGLSHSDKNFDISFGKGYFVFTNATSTENVTI